MGARICLSLKAVELEKEWVKRPVLLISLAGAKHTEPEGFIDFLGNRFTENEKKLCGGLRH